MDIHKIKHYFKKCTELNSGDSEYALLKQVGKTYLGSVIDKELLHIIVNSIKVSLDLQQNDIVVDFGCANGLITRRVSEFVKAVYGIDISDELLNNAAKNNNAENITYINCDILKVNTHDLLASKYYMYEVLQFFDSIRFKELLSELCQSKEQFQLYIGSVPDAEKLFSFYFNDERKRFYFNEVVEKKTFHIGHWWYKDHLRLICEDFGLKVHIIEQNRRLHTAHYRFDALIEKRV